MSCWTRQIWFICLVVLHVFAAPPVCRTERLHGEGETRTERLIDAYCVCVCRGIQTPPPSHFTPPFFKFLLLEKTQKVTQESANRLQRSVEVLPLHTPDIKPVTCADYCRFWDFFVESSLSV